MRIGFLLPEITTISVNIGVPSAAQLDRQIKTLMRLYEAAFHAKGLAEGFDNINRMKPVRLNVAGSGGRKVRKKPDAIQADQVCIPTEAEMDFYQGGLQLPHKSENIQKLLTDLNRTGKFDYELCYLLRKQEALDDLRDWMRWVRIFVGKNLPDG